MEKPAYWLRIQGLTEDKYEDLAVIISSALAPELEMEKEELERYINSIYQMNLSFARRNKLPSEVHMKFTKTILRDAILQATQDKKIIMQGCEVKILKEVPWNVRQKRKEYAFLTSVKRKWDYIEMAHSGRCAFPIQITKIQYKLSYESKRLCSKERKEVAEKKKSAWRGGRIGIIGSKR